MYVTFLDLVILWLLWRYVLKPLLSSIKPADEARPPPNEARTTWQSSGPDSRGTTLVACAQCGVYVRQDQCSMDQGKCFCSKECLQRSHT